jgi:DNA-binding CsgD family transcriptional regulator
MPDRSSDEAERLSHLLGDIYDAALDPARWSLVLENVASFVGGCASALFIKDSVRKTQNNIYTWGYDPEYTRKYLEEYIKLDPFTTGQFFFEIEQPISLADIMPHAEFRETRFYAEWVRPQHWIDAMGATLEKSVTSYAALSVIRHERNGVADNEARRRMALVAPHVRRAVLIGKLVDLQKIEAATLADALDSLATAVFLVEASGRIVHANAAGHVLLAEGSVLRGAGGKLAVIDASADQALHDIFANAGGGDAALGVTGVALPLLARDGERHVAHVLPLTSGARRRAGVAYSAVAAVFVRKADLMMPSSPEVIAKTYKLTPSELRVLMAIVEVGGVPEVAPVLGISETTVKTHLQRVFAKTGTRRQAPMWAACRARTICGR